ncbi:MAG TPA: sulfotransferase [Stellaceae bacterium]|nr:sulfotransferase [Stellaceae bacterium]
MTLDGVPLDYSTLKWRHIPSEPTDASDLRVRLRPFPPATFPSFLGYIEYTAAADLAPEAPAIHIIPGDDSDFYYGNLGVNPQFGTPSIIGRVPGRYGLAFNFTLPSGLGTSQIRFVFRRDNGAAERHDVGTVEPSGLTWHVNVNPQYAWPETPTPAPNPITQAFIGGAPKSGTTWIEILLNHHPDILALGEGEFLGFVQACHYRSTNRWFPPGTAYGQDLEIVHIALLKFLFDLYGSELGCNLVIDRTPGNAMRYRRLIAVLPEARLLHCTRHPLDVVVSRLFHERKLLLDGATSELAAHQDTIERIPLSRGTAGDLTLHLEQPDVWALITCILDEWIAAQREAQAVQQTSPDRIEMIRYEAMLSDPFAVCAHILSFLHVRYSPDEVHDLIARSSFESLTSRRRGEIDNNSFFRSGTPRQYLTSFSREGQRLALDYVKRELVSPTVLGYTDADEGNPPGHAT